MPRLSKKSKQEWAFFIHPKTHRRTYNEICRSCTRDCKQSFRAKLIESYRYESRRAVNYARKNAPKHNNKRGVGELRWNIPPALEKSLTKEKTAKHAPFLYKKSVYISTKGVKEFE